MSIRVINEPEPDRDGEQEGIFERRRSRRSVVKGGLMAGAVGAIAPTALAACGGDDDDDEEVATTEAEWDGETIRVVGLGVDLIDPIAEAAQEATGFRYDFTVRDTPTTTSLSITRPTDFDILSGYAHQVKEILAADVMQPIPVDRVDEWDNVVPLLKTGLLTPDCSTGSGDALYRMLPVDPDDTQRLTGGDPFEAALQEEVPESDLIMGVTGNFNVDSLGYNRDAPELEGRVPITSWAEMVNPDYAGKVAVINDPQIGAQDLALAYLAAGQVEIENTGAMTPDEIDDLMKIAIDMKRDGFFRGLWTTFDESVSLMAGGEVIIESMWSPAVALLNELGENVGFMAPEEGFRGWGGVQMVFKHVGDGAKFDACMDYLNWWLSGDAGAIMARQGYYNPVPQNVRENLSEAEWDYWYGGQPAAEDLVGPSGEAQLPEGDVREGGSFEERICNYATWNTEQPEADLLLARWEDFVAA